MHQWYGSMTSLFSKIDFYITSHTVIGDRCIATDTQIYMKFTIDLGNYVGGLSSLFLFNIIYKGLIDEQRYMYRQ